MIIYQMKLLCGSFCKTAFQRLTEKMVLKDDYLYIANDYGGDDDNVWIENCGLFVVNIKDKKNPVLEYKINSRQFSDIVGWEIEEQKTVSQQQSIYISFKLRAVT